jgi:hypothetical protein
MPSVYVIQAGGGPVKIGHARNLAERMRAIQIGSPYRLRMMFAAECIDGSVCQVERLAHAKIAASRMTGEWFDVSADVAADIIRAAAAELGVELAEVGDLVGSPLPPGKKPCRMSILMDADEVRQIDDWAAENRIRSRSKAIRELLHRALVLRGMPMKAP